ncbi:hypothetical protein [Lysobacter gummosus]|uniref:hypothetical protein n=1 Tax=Lysobacter gummosus TaxID=262324 RepID=UPI0036350D5C
MSPTPARANCANGRARTERGESTPRGSDRPFGSFHKHEARRSAGFASQRVEPADQAGAAICTCLRTISIATSNACS